MGNMTDETLEQMIERIQNAVENRSYESPYEHLYGWLQAKDPMLFKQWQAVYDITKGF